MSDETKDINNSDNLAKAKLALSGEEKLTNWKKEGEDLERRRQEAIRAMASNEQKKAWADAEKARQNKIEAQKKLAELEAKRHLSEQEKRQELSEKQRKIDEREEAKRIAQIDKILKSQREIDLIKKNTNAGPAPIRTLTRDVGEVVKRGGLSASKIVIETPDEKNLAPSKDRGSKQAWLAGIALVLIFGGLSFFLWSIQERQKESLAPLAETRQSLIFADEQLGLDLDKITQEQTRQELETKKLAPSRGKDWIQEIYFTYQKREQTPEGLVMNLAEADLTALATKLELNLPDEFLRFLEPKMMFGFYHSQQSTPFYLLRTRSYKNTADSLLNNEGLIVAELLSLITDASSTEAVRQGSFQDKMVNNYDTRLLTNETNTVVALYSWLNANTLIVTTSENTFVKVLDSFLTPKAIIR